MFTLRIIDLVVLATLWLCSLAIYAAGIAGVLAFFTTVFLI